MEEKNAIRRSGSPGVRWLTRQVIANGIIESNASVTAL
jgi:hypothetical protein